MLVKKNIVILHPSDKSACAFYHWMDDLRYISRWLRTFFGDTIQAHF